MTKSDSGAHIIGIIIPKSGNYGIILAEIREIIPKSRKIGNIEHKSARKGKDRPNGRSFS